MVRPSRMPTLHADLLNSFCNFHSSLLLTIVRERSELAAKLRLITPVAFASDRSETQLVAFAALSDGARRNRDQRLPI